MNSNLTCTLCENRCLLSDLSCPRGQRFYEINAEPYCTQCENHCSLHALSCARGEAFYHVKPGRMENNVLFAAPPGLMARFEVVSHQFGKVRGGQSSQMRVIRFLHNHGTVSQGELQLILGIKAATMSEMVNRLEEQGLVTRTMSKMDKRVRVLNLTDAGEKIYQAQIEHENQLNLFSSLTPEEQTQLDDLLGKLSYDWHRRTKETEEMPEEPEEPES